MPEEDRKFFILGCGFTMGVVVDQVGVFTAEMRGKLASGEVSTDEHQGAVFALDFLKQLVGAYQKEITSDE